MAAFPGKKRIWQQNYKRSLVSQQNKETAVQRRLYGRRKARLLNKGRLQAFENLLPALGLHDKLDHSLTNHFDPNEFFEIKAKEVWLEIGFGDGDHLASQAREHSDIAFIGAEPFENGVAALLHEAELTPEIQSRLKVWMDDAHLLLDILKPASLNRVYLLNPDPWPKTRHHKRRFIQKDTLDRLHKALKPEGLLIMATDVNDLADWMLTHTDNHPGFEWLAENQSDWSQPPEGWIETRYEYKGKEAGRRQSYLLFRRL